MDRDHRARRTAVKYTQQEQTNDNERIEAAFEALDAFRANFGDIVVLDVLTLADVAECRMSTPQGPVAAKDIYSRAELCAALAVLEDSPCADIERAIYTAVNDYRETKTNEE